jgi:anthranilate synthase/aminodeoxychorismate synthase-like glutamine amidotransferase
LLLLLDNYDSFTYNLRAQIASAGFEVLVVRNDVHSILEDSTPWQGIVISPGPGRPKDAGISEAIIRKYLGRVPILGICLGHQLIGEMFGAPTVYAPEPIHGKTALVRHSGNGIFSDLPNPLQVMRYHSLVVQNESFPDCLEITAQTEDGIIMGIQHKLYNLAGVQFHPESILTPQGDRMMQNWLKSL